MAGVTTLGFLAAALLLSQTDPLRMPAEPPAGWVTHGPGGGFVAQLVIDPSDGRTIYASTAGIFKSSDGGESWVGVSRGLPAAVESFALDPQKPDTVYFSAEGGDGSRDFKSTDGGRTWSPIGPIVRKNLYGFPYVATTLAVDPSSSDTLYAGTAATDSAHGLVQTGEIYKSVDGGLSWHSVWALAAQGGISILVDATDSSTVYALFGFGFAGTLTSGTLYRSLDGGATWHPIMGLPNLVTPPAQSAADPTSVYVGTNAGVFRSRDRGTTWASISDGLAGDALSVESLAVAPSDPSILLATTAAGVFRTVDGGSSWRIVDGAPRQQITIHPVRPATLFASGGVFRADGRADGVAKSTDGGTTWNLIDAGLNALAIDALVIAPPVPTEPATPSTIYAASNGGYLSTAGVVYSSHDGGNTWQRHAGAPNFIQDLIVDPGNPAALYAATFCGGVFRSDDGGNEWVPAGGGLTENDRCLASLAADPHVAGRLFAGTEYGRLFRTDDGGGSWTAVGPALSDNGEALVAVDPSGTGMVYLGSVPGLFRSTDSGATWELTSVRDQVFALQIDPSVPTTVYVSSYLGFFRSTDAGLTWQPITSVPTVPYVDIVFAIAVDPTRSSELVIDFGKLGILRSEDAGATWTSFNTGLVSGLRHLTFDFSAERLFGTAAGVFGRSLVPQLPRVLPPRSGAP